MNNLPKQDLNEVCSLTMSIEEIELLSSTLDYILDVDSCDERDQQVATFLLKRLKIAALLAQPTFYVNIYKHYRMYGGPEEGGWYYDYADWFDSIPSLNLDDALDTIPELVETFFTDVDENTTPDLASLKEAYLRSSTEPIERSVTVEESPDYYNSYYMIKVESMPGQSARLEAPIYE